MKTRTAIDAPAGVMRVCFVRCVAASKAKANVKVRF